MYAFVLGIDFFILVNLHIRSHDIFAPFNLNTVTSSILPFNILNRLGSWTTASKTTNLQARDIQYQNTLKKTYSNLSYNIKIEFFELIDFNPIMEPFNFRKCGLAARIIIKYIYLYYYQNIFHMNRVNSPRNLYNTVASDVQYELSRRFMNYAGQQLFQKQNLIMMESNLLIEKLGRLQYKKDSDNYQTDYCHLATLNTLDSSITEINQIPRIRKVFSRKNKNSSFVSKKSSIDQNMTDALSEIKKYCSSKTYQYMRTFTQKYQKLKKNEDQNKASGQLNLSLNGIIKNRCETDRNNHDQVLTLNIKNQKLEKQNDVLSTKVAQLQKKIEQLDLKLSEKQKINLNYSQQLARIQAKLEERVNQKDSLSDKLSTHLQKIEKFHNSILNTLQNIFIDEGCNRCCELIKKIKSSLINYKSTLAEEIELFQSQLQKLHLNMKINV